MLSKITFKLVYPPSWLYSLRENCQVQKEPGDVYVSGSGEKDKEEQWEEEGRYGVFWPSGQGKSSHGNS